MSWFRPYKKSAFKDSDASLHPCWRLATVKASPSVVSLKSYIGTKKLCIRSGFIFESEESGDKGKYFNYIVTAASLLTSSSGVVLPSDIRVEVYLSDGKMHEGEFSASNVDLHYNLAVIKISSEAHLPVARMKTLDLSIPPVAQDDDFQIDDNQELVNLLAGDPVVAMARDSCRCTLEIRVGQFSVESCKLDCQELYMTSCKNSTMFIGGPIVNRNGEVIGVGFQDDFHTPFLPTNILLRCLESFRKNKHIHRPWHGIVLADLYTAHVSMLEKIKLKFPEIRKGVIVVKVVDDSPGARVGIVPNDVIIQCNGNTISSSLEFFGMMWDKAGQSVELLVKRLDGSLLRLMMVVEETDRDKYNRWPMGV